MKKNNFYLKILIVVIIISIFSFKYKTNNKTVEVFANNFGEQEITFNDLVKDDQKSNFNNKIAELFASKYPKFVVESIKANANAKYFLEPNFLLIQYSNYEMEPYVADVELKVSYKDIAEYLKVMVAINEEYDDLEFKYDKTKPTVALTFDDGPSGEKTIRLLNILQDNKASATFFMLGSKMENDKQTVIDVYKSDNEIGYHSYDHQNMVRKDAKQLQLEFQVTDDLYYNLTNSHLNLIRPPYGNINKVVKETFNNPFILWSIDTNDWRYRDSDYLANYVIDNISDGDIVLFHDSYHTSIDAVEKMLPVLYAKGYQVVSVSELANLKGATIAPREIYHYFR